MAASECRVFLRERCVINPEPAALAGAAAIPIVGLFVPKLIEMAIGGVATLLRKAGDSETVSLGGREVVDLYLADEKQALGPNPRLGCVLGIVGTFDDPPDGAQSSTDPVIKRLEDEGLVPVGSTVDLIFEAAIRLTRDRTAFCLDTRHFSVREFIGRRNRGERAFVVTLGVTVPGATSDGETIALGTIDMGTLERGADVVPPGRPADAYPRRRSNLMPWGQIAKPSKAAYDADVAAGTAAGRTYMPVTFALTVSETADGSKLLLRLGELLDGAKQQAAADVSKLILPEERARAEAASEAAAEKLYEAELEAELALRKAQQAYNAAKDPEKPALRVELEAATRKRDRQVRLRRAAGLPDRPPVPES